MFWNRAIKAGILLGSAYYLGRVSQKMDSEREENHAQDAEFKDSACSETFHSDADAFVQAGKEALTKTAESIQGYADAVINEFERQNKNR
ncbi:MAG: hypothetical protein LKF62_05385 [Solobacterium sp.]|nr:hypothetical protein [Solobacterium sp.]